MRYSEGKVILIIVVPLSTALFILYPTTSALLWSELVGTGWFTEYFNRAPKSTVLVLELLSQLPIALTIGIGMGVFLRHRPVAIVFLSYLLAVLVGSLVFGAPDNWVSYSGHIISTLLLVSFTYLGSRRVKAT